MAISATKKFYVTDGPIPPNLGIANINQAGYDPTDRDRLAIHYNPAAGKIQLNAQNDMYGRSNIMGGSYSFDPNGDYLNSGWPGSAGTNPIHPLGSGLDNALTPATGAGGALFGDNLRVGIPRVDPGGGSSAGTIQCPYGFYQFNNVCVPGVNLDPTNPNNALGIDVGNASYQEAKGVILQVIPPVKTQKGALFQVVTQIQNIGHKAGKFYTKVSVGLLGLTDVQSNGAFLAPGQKGVVYQSLQMPEFPPEGSLFQIKSDLYKQALDNPSAPEQIQDSNQANLPNPDTTLGMPPPTPPIPNFPVSQVPNNTQGFGYPYNPPPQGPQYPRPPMPPPGFPGPFGPIPPPGFPGQYGSFAARAYFGEDPYIGYQQPYPYQDPYDMYGGYYQDPQQQFYANEQYQYGYAQQDPYGYAQQYPQYQQLAYNPANYNYQQYQYTGDPNYNPTPSPYPIYGDAASPIQQNMYYGNYQYPYQYQTPPIYQNPQQQYPLPYQLPPEPEPTPAPAPHPIINIQGGGGAAGGSIITDPVTGITTITGGGSGNIGGGTIQTSGGNSGIHNSGNNSSDDNDHHDNDSHSHSNKKKKKHKSNLGLVLTGIEGSHHNADPSIKLSPHRSNNKYSPGQRVSITAAGFAPGEVVILQVYAIRSFLGNWRFTQRLGTAYARVGQSGKSETKSLTMPNLFGDNKNMAIIAIGMYSGEKVHIKLSVD